MGKWRRDTRPGIGGKEEKGKERLVSVHIESDHISIRITAFCVACVSCVDEVLKPQNVVQSA